MPSTSADLGKRRGRQSPSVLSGVALVILVFVGLGAWRWLEDDSVNAGWPASDNGGRSIDLEIVSFADIDSVIDSSPLVVTGAAIGEPEIRRPRAELPMVDYYQDVRVEEVIRGSIDGDTVRLVTSGQSPSGDGGTIVEDPLIGPLPDGTHLLFLRPSSTEPDLYFVTGETDGIFAVGPGPDGSRLDNPSLPDFADETMEGLRKRIQSRPYVEGDGDWHH